MKPYQKKYKRKEGKKNTRWTDEDRDLLRTLHQQGETIYGISIRLDRSYGAIAQQLYLMRQRDEAEGYIHVAGGVTELSVPAIAPSPVGVSVVTSTPEELNTEPYRLTDAMLEDFDLYEPVTKPLWDEQNPSLWQRAKRWVKRIIKK